jgi:inosose dehydratase
MILYGTNPIAWANDDDQTIGADIPTERILTEAGIEIGFDGIENGHRWPDDPKELKALLGKYGLKFISGWYSTELLKRTVEAEIAAFQPHLAKLKESDCKVCVTAETSNAIHGSNKPLSEKPNLLPEEMKAFGARMERFAEYMDSQGVALAYHHHIGTVVETPEEIDAFMAATGPKTKLLFDAGHCAFGGGDPAAVLKKHVGRVVHFHAKNIRPDVVRRVWDEKLSFLEGVVAGAFTVPGDQEGGVDFEPLLEILAEAGYSGWLVIEAEQDPDVRNPLLYQTLGLATLKRLAKKTGLDSSGENTR